MKIPYVNIKKQYNSEKKKLLKIIDKSLSTGSWVGGLDIELFEKKISKICKTKYCVALNSGTDALTLALHLLGVKKGDEVITPPNSFIASTAVIVHLGAKPIFVDVKNDQSIDENKVEENLGKQIWRGAVFPTSSGEDTVSPPPPPPPLKEEESDE